MPPKAAWGHTRSFGDVGSMSGLPKSGHDWAIYEYTPELDAARRRAGSTAGRALRRHWRGWCRGRGRRAPAPAPADQRAPWRPLPRRRSPAWRHVRVAPAGIAAPAGGDRSALPSSMLYVTCGGPRRRGRPGARAHRPRLAKLCKSILNVLSCPGVVLVLQASLYPFSAHRVP